MTQSTTKLSPREQYLQTFQCDGNPNIAIYNMLKPFIKQHYPELMPLITGKQDSDDDNNVDSDKANSDKTNNTPDSQNNGKIKLPLSDTALSDCCQQIEVIINLSGSQASTINNTPFQWIANPNNSDSEVIHFAKQGIISPRSALFAYLLTSGLYDYPDPPFLLGLLLTHPDKSIQQQLTTLSPLVRFYLAWSLSGKEPLTNEATPLSKQPFAKTVQTLAQHDGYQVINPWQDIELLPALWLIYPQYKAQLLPTVWADMWLRTFQQGYERRSYRLPNDTILLAVNGLGIMQNCANYPKNYLEFNANNQFYYELNLADNIRFADKFYRGFHPYLLASALDNESESNDTPILTLCRNIIHNEDKYGRISRELIRGMLSSHNRKAWQLVADLLLTAQRQEGLRQTIIESLDEAHPDVIPFMISLILEQDLTRFSSVVRGLDVWAGLAWESQRASTVKQFLQYAKQAFAVAFGVDTIDELTADAFISKISPTNKLTAETLNQRIQRLHNAMPQWLASRNHGQIFMALWVLGCYDVSQTQPHLRTLIHDKVADRACLASYFLYQIRLLKFSMPLYYELCQREEVKVLAYVALHLCYVSYKNYMQYLSLAQCQQLFAQCEHWLEQHGTKFEKTVSGNVFSGVSATFSSEIVYDLMIDLSLHIINHNHTDSKTANDTLQNLLRHANNMPPSSRTRVAQLILPDGFRFIRYSYNNTKSFTNLTADIQKHFAISLLNDRAEDIQTACATALQTLKNLNQDDIDGLLELLAKKSTRLKKHILEILLAQPKDYLHHSVNGLLFSSNSQQRVAGLELLWHLLDSSFDDSINNSLDKDKPTSLSKKVSKQDSQHWLTKYQHLLAGTGDFAKQKALKATKAEQQQLERCQQRANDSEQVILSADNGWGLYDPNNLHACELPTLADDNIYYQLNKTDNVDNADDANNINNGDQTNNATNHIVRTQFSKPIEQINADLQSLYQLFEQNKEYEYSTKHYDGSIQTVLLANRFSELAQDIDTSDINLPPQNEQEQQIFNRRQFENYPLYELWEQWFIDVGWQASDLFLLNLTYELKSSFERPYFYVENQFFKPFFSKFFDLDGLVMPQTNTEYSTIPAILNTLMYVFEFKARNDYFIGLTCEFFKSIPSEIRQRNFKQNPIDKNQYRYSASPEGWQSETTFRKLLDRIVINDLSKQQIAPVWQLYRWWQYSGLPQDITLNQPPLELTALAYQQGIINDDEMMAVIINESGRSNLDDIQSQQNPKRRYKHHTLLKRFPFLASFAERIIEQILSVELQRDELDTPMTQFARRLYYIENTDKTDVLTVLVSLLQALAKTGIYANGIYRYYGDVSKKALFSELLQACYPTHSYYIAYERIINADKDEKLALLAKSYDELTKEQLAKTSPSEATQSESTQSESTQSESTQSESTQSETEPSTSEQLAPSQSEQTDWQHRFNTAISQANFSDELLVALATYARQWQPLVQNYLQWDGLASGIAWLFAHTKDSEYQAQSVDDESSIARYSTIELAEFKRGAVDIDWFHDAFNRLGRKRWEILYDCAKYISDGNGHRRAKLYSDVLTGDLKIREVTKKVKEKRDQDYVRLYGLVPLSKTNPDKDILTRYHTLVQFKKDSRQFGSQRQQSEGQAVEVALENLARNAGFTDPQRLTWAMETQTVQQILANATTFSDGDLSVSLRIDDYGKAHLDVTRGDKPLKSIPTKYKKDKQLQTLKNHKKTLSEQFKRSRHSLEMAMVRGDVFYADELATLFEHPVISKHLANLVFVVEDLVPDEKDNAVEKTLKNDSQNDKHNNKQNSPAFIGFYQPAVEIANDDITENKTAHLINVKGERFALTQVGEEKIRLRIAHCVDLQQAKVWADYQHHCFEQKIVQPFKQIFRELYVPTPDELEAKSVSKRYAGHQVQPAKAIALLKSRGWRADYEEGLQKLNHKLGFRVKLYALADWFTPADVEAPTLETVVFEDLNTGKPIDFERIEPRAFSEAMRDLDLVVSVAHVGGVDVSTSQSSMQLRAVLVSESMRLFKQDNVTIKERHALIKGTLGEYSVHLGSAVVHQIGGSYLSILPVHSQQRGRIFLPFMDEDPKTAELISKVLLLARDNKIQDPTILQQIKG